MLAREIPVLDCEVHALAGESHVLTCDGHSSTLRVVFDLRWPKRVPCRFERPFIDEGDSEAVADQGVYRTYSLEKGAKMCVG